MKRGERKNGPASTKEAGPALRATLRLVGVEIGAATKVSVAAGLV